VCHILSALLILTSLMHSLAHPCAVQHTADALFSYECITLVHSPYLCLPLRTFSTYSYPCAICNTTYSLCSTFIHTNALTRACRPLMMIIQHLSELHSLMLVHQ
jgi:hypothetical protein